MPGFLPWMLFRQPPLLTKFIDLDMLLYYMAVQNLVYMCGNVPQTTTESSDTPPIHCAQHVQAIHCDPVQMVEVVQQEYILIGRAWLYPRARVAIHLVLPGYVLFFRVKNSVHLDFMNLAKCLEFWINDCLSIFPIKSMLS